MYRWLNIFITHLLLTVTSRWPWTAMTWWISSNVLTLFTQTGWRLPETYTWTRAKWKVNETQNACAPKSAETEISRYFKIVALLQHPLLWNNTMNYLTVILLIYFYLAYMLKYYESILISFCIIICLPSVVFSKYKIIITK